jgi:hypothetical protein
MSVRFLAVAILSAAVLAVGPSEPGCQPRPPESDARHPSGLAVAPQMDLCHRMTPYEPLALALDRAYRFAAQYPDDIGYPWDDRGNRTLVVSAVTPRGRALLDQWSALGWEIPIRIRTVTRSFGELERVKDDVIELARTRTPGTEFIGMSAGDWERNRVVIGVARLTDELAAAIVARYGTDVVALWIGPRFGPLGMPSAKLRK